jgi:hypothetical protein
MKLLILITCISFTNRLTAQGNTNSNGDRYSTDTATILGIRYVGHVDFTGFHLKTSTSKTTVNIKGEFTSVEFRDIDLDGYKDILLDHGGNIPERYSLLLYIAKWKRFQSVSNFNLFPSPVKVKRTKYFYSYHKNGCADLDWVSDLFYIENFKAKRVGKIDAVGCGTERVQPKIYIYKISGSSQKLIETFPINYVEKFEDTKWGFIKNYWFKKYKNF